jgi:hypothetical protein
MRQLGSERRLGARHGLGAALALAVGSIALFAAGSARAGSDFGDAFEYELGRIAAQQAVYVGSHVLFGPYGGYYAPVQYAYGYGHRYGVRQHQYRPHRHSAYCGHGWSGHRSSGHRWGGHGWGGHGYRYDRPSHGKHRQRGHYRNWNDDDSDSDRGHYRRHRRW